MTPKSKAVWVDGTLYVCIAVFLFLQGYFSSDESYKYVDPLALYWIKCAVGCGGAGAAALKMFRSTTFSDRKVEDESKEAKLKE